MPTYQRLRAQIRDDIVAGVWRLGAHVTLAEFGAHYQVSNVPVREALLQLQGEGIIDMRMNRGALIPAVDAKFIDDIYALRGALQSMLARQACVRASDAELRRLDERASAYETAAAANDVAASVAANREFHLCMDGLAHNPHAVDVLQSRSCLVDAFRRSHGYGPGRQQQVIDQHRLMVKAMLERDADAASAAVLAHVESARRDVAALLLDKP